MNSRRYSTMCLSRCLIVIFAVPIIVSSAQWTGNWFPDNPFLRLSTTEIPSSTSESISSAAAASSTVASSTVASSTVASSTVASFTVASSTVASSTVASIEASSSTVEVSSTAPEEFSTATETSSTSTATPSTSPTSSTTAEIQGATASTVENWTGQWFPNKPGQNVTTVAPPVSKESNISMTVPNLACDNARDNLGIDFDPRNIEDSVVYVCFGDKHLYNPNTSYEAILRDHVISPAYRPQPKCMDTAIKYPPGIPTFGDHRPLWAKYGEYKYVPAQRWLHNIEHGAIVMLYHPCANFNQVEQLKLLVKYCIYRHVITPASTYLTPERPLALVAWGKSLEMSVVVPEIVVKFIKENALKGPEQILNNGQYDKLIIGHADIVSTADDSVLCPNNRQIPVI